MKTRSHQKRSTLKQNLNRVNKAKSKSIRTPTKVAESPSKVINNRTTTSKKGTSNEKTGLLSRGKSITLKDSKELSKNIFSEKTKGILKEDRKKSSKTEYKQFFKFHYDRLKVEHPAWKASQITSITSLYWKRFKEQSKKRTEAEVRDICENIISGKDGFRENKTKEGMNEIQIESLWKHLPVESKKKWSKDESVVPVKKNAKRVESVRLRLIEPKEVNPFSFLNKA